MSKQAQPFYEGNLLSYLSEQSRKAHSPEFVIPFVRQQTIVRLMYCEDINAIVNLYLKKVDNGVLK